MRPILMLNLLFGLYMLAAGCVKEPEVSKKANSEDDCIVKFTFALETPIETKGYVPGTDDGDIYRIDVYVFDSDGCPINWYVLESDSGLDLSAALVKDMGRKGEVRTYLIMANLDYDTAYYLHWLDYLEMSRNPEGVVPFSANFKPGQHIMGGTAKVTFGVTSSLDVKLYRYMAKIEIGTITAAFPKQSDFYRDIYVKHIVFANSWDVMRILQRDVRYLTGEPSDMFGGYKRWGYGLAFGGVTEGYSSSNTIDENTSSVFDGTYSLDYYGGRGKLALDYDYMYNNNYKLEAHEINLSCPESVKEASQHTFNVDAGYGQLCSTSYEVSPVLSVNKAFYVMPTYFMVKTTPPNSWEGQDRTHKMVIAVKINGKLYFYPLRLDYLQPNMIYKIKNISLKGEPSLYSNFFEWSHSKHDPYEPDAPRVKEFSSGRKQSWRIRGNVAEIDNLVLYGCHCEDFMDVEQ